MIWKKIFRNAGILAGITMFSNLIIATQFSWDAVWMAFLTGGLIALVEVKHAIKHNSERRRLHKKLTTVFF